MGVLVSLFSSGILALYFQVLASTKKWQKAIRTKFNIYLLTANVVMIVLPLIFASQRVCTARGEVGFQVMEVFRAILTGTVISCVILIIYLYAQSVSSASAFAEKAGRYLVPVTIGITVVGQFILCITAFYPSADSIAGSVIRITTMLFVTLTNLIYITVFYLYVKSSASVLETSGKPEKRSVKLSVISRHGFYSSIFVFLGTIFIAINTQAANEDLREAMRIFYYLALLSVILSFVMMKRKLISLDIDEESSGSVSKSLTTQMRSQSQQGASIVSGDATV